MSHRRSDPGGNTSHALNGDELQVNVVFFWFVWPQHGCNVHEITLQTPQQSIWKDVPMQRRTAQKNVQNTSSRWQPMLPSKPSQAKARQGKQSQSFLGMYEGLGEELGEGKHRRGYRKDNSYLWISPKEKTRWKKELKKETPGSDFQMHFLELWQAKTRQGKQSQGKPRQAKASKGKPKASKGKPRHGKASKGKPRQSQGKAKAKPSQAQGKQRQAKAR